LQAGAIIALVVIQTINVLIQTLWFARLPKSRGCDVGAIGKAKDNSFDKIYQ
jgi:hypothetical protein